MAEEELETNEGGKKKSKLMIIIIAVVVILLGGGAGAYFFLFSGDDASSEEVSEEGSEAGTSVPAAGQALYVAMPRPFQFNAPGVARERLVQVDVQLMVRGEDNEEKAKRHIPMIEGTLLTVFSSANADELVTEMGKKDLRTTATSQVRQVMNDLESSPVVEDVLFTGFVIQ